MLAGERLSSGYLPYSDTLTSLSPLSQILYSFLNLLFGRSAFGFRLIGVLALIVQLVLFSDYLIRNEVLKEKTYLPAVVLLSIFLSIPGFITAYPALIGNIFIVAGFSNLVKQLKKQLAEEEYFQTGFWFGIAALFYFPFWIFGIAGLLYLLIYSQTIPRKLLVMLFGLVFPMMCVFCYFYWNNSLFDLGQFAIHSLSISSKFNFPDWYITSPFLILLFLTVTGIYRNRQLVNYQLVCRQLHGLWLIIGIGMVAFMDTAQLGGFGILACPMAFFIVQFFTEMKRKFIRNILFGGTLIYGCTIGILFSTNFLSSEISEKVKSAESNIVNKKVLILDADNSEYLRNKPSTKYLTWGLSEETFSKPNKYDHLIDINEAFLKEKPEVIFDPKGYLKEIFDHLPGLSKKYKLDTESNTYFLINN